MVIAPGPQGLRGGFRAAASAAVAGEFGCVLDRQPALAGSIIFDRALSMVVYPEPVPPEMTMLNRQAPAILSAVRHLLAHRAPFGEIVRRDRLGGKLTDRDRGAAQGSAAGRSR